MGPFPYGPPRAPKAPDPLGAHLLNALPGERFGSGANDPPDVN